MSTIKSKISEDMKAAMKSGDKDKLAAIRNVHAAIRKREIDERIDLTDADVIKVLTSLVKQRQDSIEQFTKGGRQDLVDKESAELALLKAYLPEQMSEAELRAIVAAAVTEAGATTQKDMGAVMKILLPQVAGKADGKLVNQLVREKLI